MTDNGENPLPPFPFGDLPELPETSEAATWQPPLPTDLPELSNDLAQGELPSWLAQAELTLPPVDELSRTELPQLPTLEAIDSPLWRDKPVETPVSTVSEMAMAILGVPSTEPSEDTLSDYPHSQIEPLPDRENKQTSELPFEEENAVTERIVPKPGAFRPMNSSDEDLPLPPPFSLDLDSRLSPFGTLNEMPEVASPEDSGRHSRGDFELPPEPMPTAALTRTPPPSEPLNMQPVSAIWRSRKVTLNPTFEENDTVAVFRTVIRDDHNRGYLNCKVSFVLPAGLKQVQASRKPLAKKGQLHWNIGPVQPGEAIPLSVKLPISIVGREAAALPRSFEVMYQPPPGARLIGEVTAPTVVPLHETFVVNVRVGNSGEIATDKITVRIVNRTHLGQPITRTIHSLRPGDHNEVQLNLTPTHSGMQDWVVTLESPGAETAETVFSTEAKTSTLSIELVHDSMMRVDAETTFNLVVRNDSAVPASGVTAMLTVPEELTFASAVNGEYDRSLNLVGWLIGNLGPGELRTLSANLRGFAPGLIGLQARAEGISGSPTTTTSNVFVEIDARSTSSSLDKLLAAMQESLPDEAVERRETRAETGARHLIFELAETQYAVKIENIREVIRPTKVTHVPGMPEWLPGVANIRGDIISIVDLPRFLQLEESGTHRGLLIAQSDDQQLVIGLLVNSIVGIRRVPPGRAISQDLLDDNPIAAYLDGITELNGKLVPMLDLDVLFNSSELNCFQMS